MYYNTYNIETKTTIKWKHIISDHPIKGYVSPDNKFYFHLIPKNASKFISGHLGDIGWKPVHSLDKFDYKHKLVILRDPIARWVSGIIEFFYINNMIHENFEDDWNVYKKLLIHQPVQDAHTLSQIEFLYDVPLDDMQFVFIAEEKETIGLKIHNWLSTKGYENNFNRYSMIDKSNDNPTKFSIFKLIKNTAYNDQEFNTKLRSYFATTFELIDWVSTNQKWI